MANNFDPAHSYTFVLATATAGIAGFSADRFKLDVSGFENDTAGGHFSVLESGNDLLLSFSPRFLADDFDEDRDVDGDDMTLWREGFGMAGDATHVEGDADGDRDVDGADFLTWQRQLDSFPLAASANAPVPEPVSLMLIILAAAGICHMGGRKCQILTSQ